MITVKHPEEHCNAWQDEFLQKCNPDHRRSHELLFIVDNITNLYHKQAKDFSPIEQEYRDWLKGLPDQIQWEMEDKGFEACKENLSFTRYVMEKNGHGLEAFIREKMGEADYSEHQAMLGK